MTEKKASRLLKVRCPACRTLTPWADNAFRPFCSEGCKNRDLGNWAMGKYRIAGDPVGPDGLPGVENPDGGKD